MNSTRSIALIGLAVLVLVTCGCEQPQRKAKIVPITDNANAVTYSSELRGAYFFEGKDGRVSYCSEPVPDVALDTLQKLSANLSATLASQEQVNAGVASELSSKIVQLAGRTELLLIAREMMYRACEMTINDPTNADAMKLYNRVAEMIERLANAELETAAKERAKAEKELLEVQIKARKAGGDVFDSN